MNFEGDLRKRCIFLFAFLGLLNIFAWALLLAVGAAAQATIISLGALSYLFGLRHAFDADHIAAIDNVTRKLRQDGKRSISTGFYFALGHSAIVVILASIIVFATRLHLANSLAIVKTSEMLGKLISASFLSLLGIINIVIFAKLRSALRASSGEQQLVHASVESMQALLDQRGLYSRLFNFLYRRIDASWKMFPVGFLFGLGFDTTTEIAIFGVSAEVARDARISSWCVMLFPLMFAAGMTLADAADGAVMMRVYDWAFSDARKKLFFNATITAFSALAALGVGAIEWLQLLTVNLKLDGGFWIAVTQMDFTTIGVTIAILLIAFWGAAYYRYRSFFSFQPL